MIYLFFSQNFYAQNMLEGTREFYVYVNIFPDGEYLSDDIRQEIELKLRYYSIKVIDNPHNDIAPYLYVKIFLYKIKLMDYNFSDDLFVYSINLEFCRLMFTKLGSNILQIPKPVWYSNLSTGHIDAKKLKSMVNETTSDLLKYFINDYLLQNKD